MLIETNPYIIENVALFQTLYGDNLISLGGFDAIDNMFNDLDIKNLKALDVGFGLGGVAVYLAQHHQMKISGVEVHPWMVNYAEGHVPQEVADRLNFVSYLPNEPLPFPGNQFDMVYCKGVLNHIQDKAPLFKEVGRVLKPKGLFVIADWIVPDDFKPDSKVLFYETQANYRSLLQKANFREIEFRDDSFTFIYYVDMFLENLDIQQKDFERNFGKELFAQIQKTHQTLLLDLKQCYKLAVRIIARQEKN